MHRKLCKKFKFDHTNKWYVYNLEFLPENAMHKFNLRFWDRVRSPNLGQTIKPFSYLCRTDGPQSKNKKKWKKDKYLDLARDQKNYKKNYLKGEQVETLQTTALPRAASVEGRVLETWTDLLSLKRQWKIIS